MTCRIRVWYTAFRCLDRHVGTFRSTPTWHAKFVYEMSQSDAVFIYDMPFSEASIDTYRYSDRRICNMPNSCRACLIWIPRLTLSDIQIDLKVKSYSCLTYPKKSTSHLRMRNSKSIRHAYEERSISWMNMHVTCDSFHCKCYTFEINQIQKLKFLGTNSNGTRHPSSETLEIGKMTSEGRNFGWRAATSGGARQTLRRRAPNQNLNLNLYRKIPRNLSLSIWWILGVLHLQWKLSYEDVTYIFYVSNMKMSRTFLHMKSALGIMNAYVCHIWRCHVHFQYVTYGNVTYICDILHIKISLIFIGHFLQKWPIFSGSFVKIDLQLRGSYESSPPVMKRALGFTNDISHLDAAFMYDIWGGYD